MSLLELFCDVDDFCKAFYPVWEQSQLQEGSRQRQRAGDLLPSEMITIMVHFHQARYRDFKTYYLQYVSVYLRGEFPKLVSYNRFIQLMPRLLVPLCAYLKQRCQPTRGLAFVDSTALAVCDNRRIQRHRVFKDLAGRGKTSMGWFYGFKLHFVVNDQGELVACCVTAGNVDDRKPVPQLARTLWGKLFGDKGYLSKQLAAQLLEQGLTLITHVRRNMEKQLLSALDKLLLRKRAIAETVVDQLKNISQIEHTRHRSPNNFLAHLLAGLIAYTFQPKKPSLHLEFERLPAPSAIC